MSTPKFFKKFSSKGLSKDSSDRYLDATATDEIVLERSAIAPSPLSGFMEGTPSVAIAEPLQAQGVEHPLTSVGRQIVLAHFSVILGLLTVTKNLRRTPLHSRMGNLQWRIHSLCRFRLLQTRLRLLLP